MAANLNAAAQNAVMVLVTNTQIDQKTVNGLVSGNSSAGNPRGGNADAWNWISGIGSFFSSIANGLYGGAVTYFDATTAQRASQTLTYSGAPANNDTVTLGGVVITYKTSGATGSQVNIGGSQAAAMANLVTFINIGGSANNIATLCTAVVTSANVVTVTSIFPGIIGNLITLAKSAANIAVGGATLTGGAISTYQPVVTCGI